MIADHRARCINSPDGVPGLKPPALIFFFLAVLPFMLTAQQPGENIIAELHELATEFYGPDQHLVNGIEYVNLHIRSSGHKFLDEDRFYEGRVVIDNKVYHHVFLKYDIYNQQVLLLIRHHSGGHKQIILNTVRIDEFEINGRKFRKYAFPGTGTRFYQVIGSDEMACLYHFSKLEILNPVDRYTISKFTEEKKKSYLYGQSKVHEFKGSRSFVRVFHDHQPQIKAYIRKNKFRVRKLSDAQMLQLISYCTSLTAPDITD
jgi:hypothetical protein